MKSGTESKKFFDRACKVIPGGVSSNFRYWGDDATLVVDRGEGAYLYDKDNKKYVDYRLGFGPVVLGHGRPEISKHIKEVLDKGNCFAMTNEYEIRVAEKLTKMTGTDLVRFTNTGTEATMGAMRIARAYTGRDKILKFDGAYHGFHDYSLWNTYPPTSGVGYINSPFLIPQGSGIPRSVGDLMYSLPFNNKEVLDKKLKERWHEIACIIVEPLLGNQASIMPQDGFLDFIREKCTEYGIVMIMDEVKTGFRIAPGGAQEYFHVKADIATYAKCLGNGFPVAAIAGKREIMGEVGPGKIPHGGTYGSNMISMAAAEACLDLYAAGELKKADAHGKKLKQGWKTILDKSGLAYVIQGPDSMPGIIFTNEEKCTEYKHWAQGDHDTYEKIIHYCINHGVMPDYDSREPWFISTAHTDEDADFVLGVFEDAVKFVNR
ncbi:MAG: aspartate aminotransferase family protein [Spirochaetales bacterium]|nr:aspartate aminotransferase family protein [Spirochaetales bacterium]